MLGRVLIVFAASIALGGCLVDVDLSGAMFRCSAARPECPPNTSCDGTFCRQVGQTDASALDANAVCGDELCTETCETCAADCGICIAGQTLYLSGDSAESEQPIDASGSNFVVNAANVGRVDSPRGRAFSFDGSDGIVSLSDAEHLKTQEFAATALIRSTMPGTPGREIVSMGDNWGLRIMPDASLRLFVYGGASYVGCQSTPSKLLDGAWHHVAGQKTDGELTIFIDGAVALSCLMPAAVVYDFGDDFTVGQHGVAEAGYSFNGDIDEVRVFDRGLSAAEIAAFAAM